MSFSENPLVARQVIVRMAASMSKKECRRRSDEQQLADVFQQHRDRLLRMVHFRMDRRLAGRVDADDVLQEAFLAATERIDHYRQRSSMSPFVWLRLVVGQTLVDVHRRHLGAKKRDAGLDISLQAGRHPQASSVALADYLVGNATSPSRALMRDEMAAAVEAALAEMEPIDREVLVLRHFEDLSNSEVAEELSIMRKAASIRYVRALKRLKSRLAKMPGFSAD